MQIMIWSCCWNRSPYEAAQMSNIARQRGQFHAALRARLSAINAKRHIMASTCRVETVLSAHVDTACLRFALDTSHDPISGALAVALARNRRLAVIDWWPVATRRHTPYVVFIESCSISPSLNSQDPLIAVHVNQLTWNEMSSAYNRYTRHLMEQERQKHLDVERRLTIAS